MNVLAAILLLGVLVAIHEFGHFIVAKISGMYVEKFSIGVGPEIASFHKGETDYVFSVIPAGGFVSVRGLVIDPEDDELEENDDPRLFQNRPIIHRLLFAIAGPVMNFVFAIAVLVTCYLALGVSVPNYDSPAIIAEVNQEGAADMAGIKVGDEIVAIGGNDVSSWSEVDSFMEVDHSVPFDITVMRDGQTYTMTVTPQYSEALERHALGITKQIEYVNESVTVQDAFKQSMFVTARMSTMILDAVGDLVTRKTAVNDEEAGLTGPVGIVKVIGDTIHQGVWNVATLLAVFSINLGLLNMLPVPGLDGSRVLFTLIEAVRGIPISADKEMFVNFLGFVAIMALMIYVTYNDLIRLVN